VIRQLIQIKPLDDISNLSITLFDIKTLISYHYD